jgi:hypothetical protein
VDGRPVVIEADDKGLLVTAVTFRAAWSMGRHVDAVFPLLLALRNAGVPLRVGVAGLGVVNWYRRRASQPGSSLRGIVRLWEAAVPRWSAREPRDRR